MVIGVLVGIRVSTMVANSKTSKMFKNKSLISTIFVISIILSIILFSQLDITTASVGYYYVGGELVYASDSTNSTTLIILETVLVTAAIIYIAKTLNNR